MRDLFGCYTPLVTPFRDDTSRAIDFAAVERLVEAQVAGGSHGVVVAGSTGEPTSLTLEERRQLVSTVVRAAAGRLRVVAGTGAQSLAETIELTSAAEAAGVDAALVVTPYYSTPPQRGLVEYYAALGAVSDLPLLIYNIPRRTGVRVELDTVEEIAERVDSLIGMKLAVDDVGMASRVLARLGSDFRLFVGLEHLSFPLLCIGACGLMNAVGNIAPQVLRDLYEAAVCGDLVLARRLHYRLLDVNDAVFWDANPIPIKYLTARMGLIASAAVRTPLAPALPELAARLDSLLDTLQLARTSP